MGAKGDPCGSGVQWKIWCLVGGRSPADPSGTPVVCRTYRAEGTVSGDFSVQSVPGLEWDTGSWAELAAGSCGRG